MSLPKRLSGRVICGRRLIAFAILLPAFACVAAVPAARAQSSWDGTVEVSLDRENPTSGSSIPLNFNNGNSVTYWFRLSKQPDKQPSDLGWWIRIHVDGGVRADGVYKGFRWVPSVGREFDRNSVNDDDPTPWRNVTVTKLENVDIDGDGDVDADDEKARPTSLTFSHEVWDHDGECPIHNVGVISIFSGGNVQPPVVDTDVDEPPLTPAPPVVSSVANSATSLSVSWTPPDNTGRPPITSYDLQYREGTSGPWTDGPQNVTGTIRTIPNLNSDTDYQVHIRATNAEGDSGWSGPGSGRTNAPANNAPRFSSSTATRSFQENEGDATTTSAMDLGAAFAATDADTNDTLRYSLEGPDAASFTVDPLTGQLKTNSNTNYDHEAKARYSVTVKVSDGTASDTIVVTINVTDLREPPLKPARPSVSPVADNATSLSLTWTAPPNAGRPDITGYDLQYRETPDGNWRNGPQNVDGTEATIAGLRGNRDYEVHVRATNAEGDSEWSDPGSARTVNSAPVYSADSVTRTLQEHLGDATETSERNIGAAIRANDADANTLTYTVGKRERVPLHDRFGHRAAQDENRRKIRP